MLKEGLREGGLLLLYWAAELEKGYEDTLEVANGVLHALEGIGNGTLVGRLKAIAGSYVEFLGHRDWDEIKALVGKVRFCVVSSEWDENNPLSVIEAQCLGTPVLDARIGGYRN